MKRLLAIAVSLPALSHALPTMVRLGYGNCLSCHVSPQGGGILNEYGKGIDQAQSLQGGEYRRRVSPVFDALSWNGRIEQDLRSVLGTSLSHNPGGPYLGVNRGRFFYRNVTTLGAGFRLSAVIGGESDPTPRRVKSYDPAVVPGQVWIGSAMLQYRPRDGFEIGVGQDALPTGLNIPDQTTFIKARNRLGYYDTPSQAKAFFWGKRYMISPFAFGPSGHEPHLMRESGGGLLAEYDLLGKGKTILGVNALRGSDRIGNRAMTGVYTRLGFGAWGILAEHDFTARQLRATYKGAHFNQNATYGQVFFYPREWMALSAIVERLGVQRPYPENLMVYKGELSTRLSTNFTIAVRGGVQRDGRTGALAPVATLQLAMKTVR